MDRVLHLTIYLTDMADRPAFNEVYQRFFAKPWPVRAAVGVAALAVEGCGWKSRQWQPRPEPVLKAGRH